MFRRMEDLLVRVIVIYRCYVFYLCREFEDSIIARLVPPCGEVAQ